MARISSTKRLDVKVSSWYQDTLDVFGKSDQNFNFLASKKTFMKYSFLSLLADKAP